MIGPSTSFNNRRVQIVTLAAYHKVPAIYSFRDSAEAGGLVSYGANLADAHHQLGVYTGRILKGQKPADLPVVQSAKFEFVINLNTARAFGLNIPRRGDRRFGLLVNVTNPLHVPQLRETKIAAEAAGVELVPVEVSNPDKLDSAFATLGAERVEGLLVPADTTFFQDVCRLPASRQRHVCRRFMVFASTSKLADS